MIDCDCAKDTALHKTGAEGTKRDTTENTAVLNEICKLLIWSLLSYPPPDKIQRSGGWK